MAKPKALTPDPFGKVPVLPTSGELQGNVTGILNQAIPGYSGLTQSASGIIGSALKGQVPTDVQNLINTQSANQAVLSGMPGTSTTRGTLAGNRTLRDLGLTSLQRQDEGVKGLLGMLQGVSGTAAPTYGQLQDQENTRAQYAAAPDPAAAIGQMARYANSGGESDGLPWYLTSNERGLVNSGQAYSVDPLTGNPTKRRY